MRMPFLFCWVVAVVGLSGCRGGKMPVIPVTGELHLKGRDGKLTPMSGAALVLNPTENEDRLPAFPRAKVKEGGTFEVGTYGENDGAPEGEYVVTLEWRKTTKPKYDYMVKEVQGDDILRGAYSNRKTSKLRVTVKAGEPLKIVIPQP